MQTDRNLVYMVAEYMLEDAYFQVACLCVRVYLLSSGRDMQ